MGAKAQETKDHREIELINRHGRGLRRRLTDQVAGRPVEHPAREPREMADPPRGPAGIVGAGQSERLGEARFQVLRIQIERVRVTEGDEQTPTAEAVIVGHCPRLVAGAKQREVPADQRLEGGPGTVIRRAERLQLGPEGGRAGAAR